MDINLKNNENPENFVSPTGCHSNDSPHLSIEEEEGVEKNGTAIAKPTFKSVLQAKKRLQAFSSQKLLIASSSPKKTSEESDKNDKTLSTKKAKRELYPDEKFKSTIKEIESIKMSEGGPKPVAKPDREIMEEINKSDFSKNVFSLSKTSGKYVDIDLTETDNHFRKIEVKSRNYRRTEEIIKESSPSSEEKKSHRSHKKDGPPKNWLEYKEQNIRPGKDSHHKTGSFSDFVKFFTFETPSPSTPDVKYKNDRGHSIVPFHHIRQTKCKPHISFSVNSNTNKQSYMSKKQLMDMVPSSRRELINKLFNGSSKVQQIDNRLESRKWFPKTWKKNDNAEGKLLENSVGLSFLQSYSDGEDVIEETIVEEVKEKEKPAIKENKQEVVATKTKPSKDEIKSESPVKVIINNQELKSKWEEESFEKKEDSFEKKKENSFEKKKEDSFEKKKEDSFEKKKEDSFEKKKEDSFEKKREDNFEKKKEDKNDAWEVTTPPKLDKSQTPDIEDNKKTDKKKKKKSTKKETLSKKRKKKVKKRKVKEESSGEDRKRKKKGKETKEKKKKRKKSTDKESEERKKYIEDLIEQIDHVEKIKSKKEKEQKLKKKKNDNEHTKNKSLSKKKPDEEKKSTKRKRSKSKDAKEKSEKSIKESSSEESRTPQHPNFKKSKSTSTPSTEGYNSCWESEDEAQTLPANNLNRSWESDEEVFERERYFSRPVEVDNISLEIPLNIKSFSRRKPQDLDKELKILKDESKTLSEERLRLEREKIKVQQLEAQYENLERKSKADKKKYEEIYQSYKVSKEVKPDYNKFEIIDMDLTKVKLENKNEKPNVLENEYEEFMKAVTDKEVTPIKLKIESSPIREKTIKIDDNLTSTPKPLIIESNTIASEIPLPLPMPVPSPQSVASPIIQVNSPIKTIASPIIQVDLSIKKIASPISVQVDSPIKKIASPIVVLDSPIKKIASPKIDSNSFDIAEKKPFIFSIPSKKQLVDTKLNLDDESDEETTGINKLSIMAEMNDLKKDNNEVLRDLVILDETKPKESPQVKKDDNNKRKEKEKEKRRSPPRRRSPNRRSPVRKRLSGRRSRSPRSRKISPRGRKRSPSPRHIKRRSKSPKRKLSPRHRSVSPRNKPSSPKRRRSSPIRRSPITKDHQHKRSKSPTSGLKKSVADSTISDDLLPQPDYVESPITRFNDKNNRQSDSPKRPSLDMRINQLCGLHKQQEIHQSPQTYDHNHQYGDYNRYNHQQQQHQHNQYGGGVYGVAGSPNIQVPITNKPQVNQVVQVGNMIQIVPTEDIPVPNVKVGTPQQHRQVQQIVQVGNMLQIVPQNLSPGMTSEISETIPSQPPVAAPLDTSATLIMAQAQAQEKSSIEDVMKQKNAERRAEREKRRQERERRRKEKEKRRKEKEKQKLLKIKLRNENLIKKALQQETEDLDGAEEEEEPQWLTMAPTVVFDSSRSAEKSAMLRRPDCASISTHYESRSKKSVRFADGVCPGEGTSPSGGEELSSPPPLVKKLKKTKVPKKLKKKKIRVKVVKRHHDSSDEDDNLPPPSPPPGSPPPHIFPARIKTHTINNIHPQQFGGGAVVPPPPYGAASIYGRPPPNVIGIAPPPPPPPHSQVVHVYQNAPPPMTMYGAPSRPPPGGSPWT